MGVGDRVGVDRGVLSELRSFCILVLDRVLMLEGEGRGFQSIWRSSRKIALSRLCRPPLQRPRDHACPCIPRARHSLGHRTRLQASSLRSRPSVLLPFFAPLANPSSVRHQVNYRVRSPSGGTSVVVGCAGQAARCSARITVKSRAPEAAPEAGFVVVKHEVRHSHKISKASKKPAVGIMREKVESLREEIRRGGEIGRRATRGGGGGESDEGDVSGTRSEGDDIESEEEEPQEESTYATRRTTQHSLAMLDSAKDEDFEQEVDELAAVRQHSSSLQLLAKSSPFRRARTSPSPASPHPPPSLPTAPYRSTSKQLGSSTSSPSSSLAPNLPLPPSSSSATRSGGARRVSFQFASSRRTDAGMLRRRSMRTRTALKARRT